MATIHLLCVEDEPDVLEAMLRDLTPFVEQFPASGAADAAEAREFIAGLHPEEDRLGLILCDHIMPGERGVAFLSWLHQPEQRSLPLLKHTRKVLFTGQAGLDDTIRAINEGGIHHYLAKPWEEEELQQVVKKLLTDFVLASGLSPLPYLSVLDGVRLARALHDDNSFDETG